MNVNTEDIILNVQSFQHLKYSSFIVNNFIINDVSVCMKLYLLKIQNDTYDTGVK